MDGGDAISQEGSSGRPETQSAPGWTFDIAGPTGGDTLLEASVGRHLRIDKLLKVGASLAMIAAATATGYEIVSTVADILTNASTVNVAITDDNFTHVASNLDWWRAGIFLSALAVATAITAFAGLTGLARSWSPGRAFGPTQRFLAQVASMITIAVAVGSFLYAALHMVNSCGMADISPCPGPLSIRYSPLLRSLVFAATVLAVGLSTWRLSTGATRLTLRCLLAGLVTMPASILGIGAIALSHVGGATEDIPAPPEATWIASHFVSNWYAVTGHVRVEMLPQCSDAIHCVALGNVASRKTFRTVVETSDDGGRTWHASLAHGLPPFSVGLFGAFQCPDYRHCWMSPFTESDHASVFSSSDGGRAWTGHNIPGDTIPMTTSFGTSCPTAQVCYVAGIGAGVFKTDDGGGTWHRVLAPPNTMTDAKIISCGDRKFCIVALTGVEATHLEVTDDGGDTWHTVGASEGRVPGFEVISCPPSSVCDVMWTSSNSNGTEPFGAVSMLSIQDNGTISSSSTLPAPTATGRFQSFSLRCTDGLHCLALTSVANANGSPLPYSFWTNNGGILWTSSLNALAMRHKLRLSGYPLVCDTTSLCWAIGIHHDPVSLVIIKSADFGRTWKAVHFASIPIQNIDAASQ